MPCDLSKTEMEIMQVLWSRGGKMPSVAIMDVFIGRGRNWKRQTLNTLLKRMEEKGVIVRTRGSVRTLCSELEYRHWQSREIVEESFAGKLDLFVAAYMGKEILSPELLKEFAKLMEKMSQDAAGT